jgi:hypothetical protein
MPGPAPKPDALRRNARVGTVRLPAEGRKGSPPKWPIERPSAAEKRVWVELWATPQAVQWERLGWTRTVARYCRVMLAAEAPNAPALVMSEARQMEDRLGLTPKAMRTLLWEIVADEVGERRDSTSASTARRRIKAV